MAWPTPASPVPSGSAGELPAPAGDALATPPKQSFVDGIGMAALVACFVVIAAAIAAWFLLPAHFGMQAVKPAGDAGTDLGDEFSLEGSLDIDDEVVPVPATPAAADESAAGNVIDEGTREPEPVID